MTSSTYTAFPDDSEFLDSEPLHLSGGSAGLDAFDFNLDVDEDDELVNNVDDEGEGGFASSRGSADLDALLCEVEETGAEMDFEFDTLKSSLKEMGFGAIEEGDETMRSSSHSNSSSSYRPHRSGRRRSPQARNDRFSMSAVNFDPPAAPQQLQQRHSYSLTQSMPPQRVSDFGPPRRLTSESDLSMCSYATAQSSSPLPNPLPPAFRRASEGMSVNASETSYDEALSNLAESMKRTEATRRHVIMQRNMLTPAQQAALSSAKEQLQARNQQLQQQQAQQPPMDPQAQDMHDNEEESSQRSSIMAAFFSGSRGTLTNGLEQSRRQLSMYMGQVNNQTL